MVDHDADRQGPGLGRGSVTRPVWKCVLLLRLEVETGPWPDIVVVPQKSSRQPQPQATSSKRDQQGKQNTRNPLLERTIAQENKELNYASLDLHTQLFTVWYVNVQMAFDAGEQSEH